MITIYTTPACVYCKKAKEFFKNNDLSYQEFDVASNEDARNEMFSKTQRMSVPTIEVNGTVIVGFSEDAVLNALKPKEVAGPVDPAEENVCDSCA